MTAFDPEDLTLNDIDELLKISGKENLSDVFEKLDELTKDTIPVLAYLLYVNRRSTDPDFTPEAARALPLREFKSMLAETEANPTTETSPDS